MTIDQQCSSSVVNSINFRIKGWGMPWYHPLGKTLMLLIILHPTSYHDGTELDNRYLFSINSVWFTINIIFFIT